MANEPIAEMKNITITTIIAIAGCSIIIGGVIGALMGASYTNAQMREVRAELARVSDRLAVMNRAQTNLVVDTDGQWAAITNLQKWVEFNENRITRVQEQFVTIAEAQSIAAQATLAKIAPPLHIIPATFKWNRKGYSYDYYAWRFMVKNNTQEPVTKTFKVQLVDARGFEVGADSARALILPGTTEEVTGEAQVKMGMTPVSVKVNAL